ncbi:GNAT family N-acetyltransferase [Niveibacterium umoris]|uniref:Ribosomal protein S18 acetylase RimI-like enzyme n=1 Tax=Niveibacterium umoris TaxID=1193620 RepID=A0A840BUN9_9RHOO|nr:GNAT family N-acetyltransferase [Niveibacterium umoris]MBB4014067.1 ribosomal protein S18 acetylase RimI-like enzyme [Niveibacterium umoris]
MFNIRAATSRDAVAVADVLLSSRRQLMPQIPLAHDEASVRKWVALHLIPCGHVIVAERKQRIVGFCALAERGGYGWIDQLYVRPDAIDTGVGSALLGYAICNLPFPVRLWCFRDNPRACGFYERRGFEVKLRREGTAADNEEGLPDLLYELPDRRLDD